MYLFITDTHCDDSVHVCTYLQYKNQFSWKYIDWIENIFQTVIMLQLNRLCGNILC